MDLSRFRWLLSANHDQAAAAAARNPGTRTKMGYTENWCMRRPSVSSHRAFSRQIFRRRRLLYRHVQVKRRGVTRHFQITCT